MSSTDETKIEMTPDEKAFIAAFVAEHCIPHETVIASIAASRIDAVSFVFMSVYSFQNMK